MTSSPYGAPTRGPVSATDGALSSWRRWRLTLASFWFIVVVSAFVSIDIQRQVTIPLRDGQPNIRLSVAPEMN